MDTDHCGEPNGGTSKVPSCSSTSPGPSLSSNSTSDDASGFECNICFELAQDPIVTLCGHLYCWPCLYRWLSNHSLCHECPVCKAYIEKEKLVPLYGRGKSVLDPRTQPVPGIEIPSRPTGQRPEIVTATENHNLRAEFANVGMISWSAFASFSPAFFPSLFNLQVHGLHNATLYEAALGFPHGGHVLGFYHSLSQGEQSCSSVLKLWLLFLGFVLVLSLVL
ncbi:E3 ubiquitin-protein ligase [Quillaja saponaria]|uniref:E3 ubiquitin-protein ligase RMA n=1 Tax=Quillaja saponaria TaxID=32244 RepID=A0AAD7PTY4_QUISA|nr:E3 ubiquitin-protein ligase [Quillaja saponaria]